MFVDTIDKVGLIRIERRVGVRGSGGVGVETFVPRNPQLAAQVTDQLISLAGA